jgi:LmbE family N-acetylglucosaminyl deacetylase
MASVLFVVAHPDDLAYGMGGLALLQKGRFDLHVVCATKGERGVSGKGLKETGAIREEEQKAECRRLGAELTFLDRIDRELYADMETCRHVAELVQQIVPVALFTLWPVDRHPDHSAISEIAMKAVFMAQKAVEIVYCEEGDDQTVHFSPTTYIDISPVIDQKLELVRCHQCQNRDDSMAQACLKRASQRGTEANCAYAEGFLSLPWPGADPSSILARSSLYHGSQ